MVLVLEFLVLVKCHLSRDIDICFILDFKQGELELIRLWN